MYSIGQITWTSVLGGPLAGVYLIVKNEKLLGREDNAKESTIVGVIFTLAVMVVAIYLPERAPGVVYAGIVVGLVRAFATKSQGDEIQEFFANSGTRGSNWKCVGLGLIFLIITLAVFTGFLLVIATTWPDILPDYFFEPE